MKIFNAFILASVALSGTNLFAASAACKKMASDRASLALNEKVADDCFQMYIQESHESSDVFYIGFSCDHAGDYQYKVVTQPDGGSCRILSINGASK